MFQAVMTHLGAGLCLRGMGKRARPTPFAETFHLGPEFAFDCPVLAFGLQDWRLSAMAA